MASKLPKDHDQPLYTKVYLYGMSIDTHKHRSLLDRLSELMANCYLK